MNLKEADALFFGKCLVEMGAEVVMVTPADAIRRPHYFFQPLAMNSTGIHWKLNHFLDSRRIYLDQPIIKILINVSAIYSESVATLDGVYHQVGDSFGV
jgi:hypothetical protein